MDQNDLREYERKPMGHEWQRDEDLLLSPKATTTALDAFVAAKSFATTANQCRAANARKRNHEPQRRTQSSEHSQG